jgi:protein SCO1
MPCSWAKHCFLLITFAAPMVLVQADETPGNAVFDEHKALAISQGAIGTLLDDYRFTARDGSAFTLRDLGGRPLVISLIYSSCFHTCPLITRRLAQAVEVARAALGADAFNVLTIGFDAANDTPERMRVHAREQGVDDPSWRFASTDADTIDALTLQLGFIYFASPRGFDHLAQVSIVDSNQRVHHQVYGSEFKPRALVEPLRGLALGAATRQTGIAGLLERVRLFCTVYDARSGRYRFDYSLIVALVTGVMCLTAIAVFVVHAWRDARMRNPMR